MLEFVHQEKFASLKCWYRTATVSLRKTVASAELIIKKTSRAMLEDLFDDPDRVIEQESAKEKSTRPPLQPSSNNSGNILVGQLDSNSVREIGSKFSHSFEEKPKNKLYQLKLEKAPGKGNVTVNIYRTNSTVTVQKSGGVRQVKYSRVSVAMLENILQMNHQTNSAMLAPRTNQENEINNISEVKVTLLQRELMKTARETEKLMKIT